MDNIIEFPNEKQRNLITLALNEYAKELITEEQIERILAPIKARIEAGEFSTPRKKERYMLPIEIDNTVPDGTWKIALMLDGYNKEVGTMSIIDGVATMVG